MTDQISQVTDSMSEVGERSIVVKLLNGMYRNKTYSIYIPRGLQGNNGGTLDKDIVVSFSTPKEPVWESQMKTLFQTKCAGCHSDYADRGSVYQVRRMIANSVSSGRMPRSTTMTQAEKTTLINYVNAMQP